MIYQFFIGEEQAKQLLALSRYAKEQGKSLAELTQEEVEQFAIKSLG